MANKTTKIFAFLALFGIIISIIGTALLIFFGDSTEKQEKVITQKELQKILDEQKVEITSSGTLKK